MNDLVWISLDECYTWAYIEKDVDFAAKEHETHKGWRRNPYKQVPKELAERLMQAWDAVNEIIGECDEYEENNVSETKS